MSLSPSPSSQFEIWEGAPLLLHTGLHKTATTWIQRRLFAGADNHAFELFEPPREVISAIIVPHDYSFDPAAANALWRDLAARARARNAVAVISAEALSSYPFLGRNRRREIAQRLAQVFPTAKILITIREQDRLIHSMYGQFLRFGRTASLEGFLARPPEGAGYRPIFEYEYYEFDRLLALYRTLFGEGHVMMAAYESYTRDLKSFFAGLSNLMGRELAPPREEIAAEQQNVGLSGPARYVLRQANRFVTPELRWRRKSSLFNPNALAHWVNRFSPKSMRQASIEKDRRLIREMIGDYYAPSNQRLAQMTGIDCGALGYRMP